MQHCVQLLRHESLCNVADDGHGETVACNVAEEADSTSATVARNVACNNFKGRHDATFKLHAMLWAMLHRVSTP